MWQGLCIGCAFNQVDVKRWLLEAKAEGMKYVVFMHDLRGDRAYRLKVRRYQSLERAISIVGGPGVVVQETYDMDANIDHQLRMTRAGECTATASLPRN